MQSDWEREDSYPEFSVQTVVEVHYLCNFRMHALIAGLSPLTPYLKGRVPTCQVALSSAG